MAKAKKIHPYPINPKYKKKAAYFCMEFAIHQSLKIYSGGLGFLAGSHMRSAYELRQNLIGIGMLWKYGYYDQVRRPDNGMEVLFQKKQYSFLEDTGIMVPVYVNRHQVYVKALYLKPEIFGTCPMYFLTTDIPENDYLAQTITHKLYDSDTAARIAQNIVLGIGGAKVVEQVCPDIEIYHMNEAHALPLAFHLYTQHKDWAEVKKRLVFTTHTPEKAGNEEHNIHLLDKMGFFDTLSLEEVRRATGEYGDMFSHTLAALRLAKVANGVSQLHGKVAREMWGNYPNICEIKAITNAQNKTYWADGHLQTALEKGDDAALKHRKMHLKKRLIEQVANQTGKLFKKEDIIIVWARRFAEYKRADLIKHDIVRFQQLMARTDKRIQIIWAGKPYPSDVQAIATFNHLVEVSRNLDNAAVLLPYELELSMLLKKGADVWLNTPRRPREASGTSGMTAAMNGAINFSIQDGWVCEWGKHKHNSFLIPVAPDGLSMEEVDKTDYNNMMDVLENDLLPLYYDKPDDWFKMMKTSMKEIIPYFDSNRMADEYYQLYNDKLK
jgi:starch phosphorylase